MAQQNATTRVVAAVVRRGEQLLVCRRAAHKRHGGLWEFPGGKVGEGERDAVALARELREELDVTVVSTEPAEFEAADPDSQYVIAFAPVTIKGEPVCSEHSELTWAAPRDLRDLPLAPSDARYVEWILAGRNGG